MLIENLILAEQPVMKDAKQACVNIFNGEAPPQVLPTKSKLVRSRHEQLAIKATGEDSSGSVVLMYIPDDVVMQRAAAIRASKLEEIRGYVDQINGNVSSPILRFIYETAVSDEAIDRDLDLVRVIAHGLAPVNTARR